jgi:hypothetical protein
MFRRKPDGTPPASTPSARRCAWRSTFRAVRHGPHESLVTGQAARSSWVSSPRGRSALRDRVKTTPPFRRRIMRGTTRRTRTSPRLPCRSLAGSRDPFPTRATLPDRSVSSTRLTRRAPVIGRLPRTFPGYRWPSSLRSRRLAPTAPNRRKPLDLRLGVLRSHREFPLDTFSPRGMGTTKPRRSTAVQPPHRRTNDMIVARQGLPPLSGLIASLRCVTPSAWTAQSSRSNVEPDGLKLYSCGLTSR